MEMFNVESSNVVSIGWENENLYVQYKTGLYEYKNVSRELFLELLGSKSRGHFMNENIKGKFEYKRIKD